jgi:alpha-glucosidase/alpha-D-xyloside xylohydrolase
MPIYVRAGAIIPFDPIRQFTGEAVTEPTTVRVFRGANGQFTLYEDDGLSQEYLKGRGSWSAMTWDDRARQLTIEPAPPRGATNAAADRLFRVVLLPEGTTRDVIYSGKRVQVALR